MRILFTTAYGYWGGWVPTDLDSLDYPGMIAGGEQAMIRLSNYLASQGHQVMVFYDSWRPGRYNGVDYLPKALAIPMLMNLDHDVHISFESVPTIEVASRAKLTIFAMQCNVMTIGLRDVLIDHYQCVSRWHADTLYASDPTVNASKFVVVPNGWHPADFGEGVERVPYRVIYASSPDRGLHHLLRIWPKIKKQVPQAELVVLYDIKRWYDLIVDQDAQGWHLLTADRAYEVKRLLEATAEWDVKHLGAVSHRRAIQEIQKASLMVYSCDPIQSTEGFSNVVLESLAAGTPAIISDADAFPELWKYAVAEMLPLPIEDDQWVEAIVKLLTHQEEWDGASKYGKVYAQSYIWQEIGSQYETFLYQALARKGFAEGQGWEVSAPQAREEREASESEQEADGEGRETYEGGDTTS